MIVIVHLVDKLNHEAGIDRPSAMELLRQRARSVVPVERTNLFTNSSYTLGSV
jgi:hypothetical protein